MKKRSRFVLLQDKISFVGSHSELARTSGRRAGTGLWANNTTARRPELQCQAGIGRDGKLRMLPSIRRFPDKE